MARFLAFLLLVTFAGALDTVEAATIRVGYVNVAVNPINDFATLDMFVRANNYANPYWPLITDVKVIGASAQLYQGVTPFGAPKTWDVSPGDPLSSSIGESLAGGDGFFVTAGVTSAVISFIVDPLGSWDLKTGPNFNPADGPQYTAILNGTGAGGLFQSGDYVELLVTGDFDVVHSPEPSTVVLSLSAIVAFWVRRRSCKRAS